MIVVELQPHSVGPVQCLVNGPIFRCHPGLYRPCAIVPARALSSESLFVKNKTACNNESEYTNCA